MPLKTKLLTMWILKVFIQSNVNNAHYSWVFSYCAFIVSVVCYISSTIVVLVVLYKQYSIKYNGKTAYLLDQNDIENKIGNNLDTKGFHSIQCSECTHLIDIFEYVSLLLNNRLFIVIEYFLEHLYLNKCPLLGSKTVADDCWKSHCVW